MAERISIWTVGHSNATPESFVESLERNEIKFLVDVRSHPYSRFADHFNREVLGDALEDAGIRYVFMGEALGGRPSDDSHLDSEGHALYSLMAATPSFAEGVERVLDGATKGRLAIMCSCGKPDDCHRRLLVGKVLTDRGAELVHILPDGTTRIETEVLIGTQPMLFDDPEVTWRSIRSVSPRRPPNTSSAV
jgi:uncharacterized protein (DUF488 family)